MRICLIVNRASRRGCQKRLLDRIHRELSGCDLSVALTGTVSELSEVVEQAKAAKVDALVVVGGDGTVSHVLEYLAFSGIALGIIPTGTANDLATNLGIPRGVKEACMVIKNGRTKDIDLLEVNGRLFVTAGGIGVVAETGIGVNRWKSKGGLLLKAIHFFGSLVYVTYSFYLLLFARSIVTEAEVLLDGKSEKKKKNYIALFVHNQPSLGKVVVPCPAARSDDHLLDVCLMTERKGLRRLGAVFTVILMSAGGSHQKRKEIRIERGQKVEIRCRETRTFMADGESLSKEKTFEIKVVPGALKVLAANVGEWSEKKVERETSDYSAKAD